MNDMISYLKLVYQSIYLPIHYYKEGKCLLQIPESEEAFDFTEVFLPLLKQTEKKMHYIISDEFLYFGIVRNFSTGEDVVLGPAGTAHIGPNELPRIMAECSISAEHKDAVKNYFQILPPVSHDRFLYLLALINAGLNQEVDEPFCYFGYAGDHSDTINEKHTSMLYEAKEKEVFHNSYQYEQQLYHYVETGNVEAIQNLPSMNITTGTIGKNSLRQAKNLFITLVTLLTRHGIAGGLDVETAYQLSDTYIQESERAQSVDTVKRLSYTAILDFTRRVAANKIPRGMSPDIFQCIQFISTHTNQPLSIEDVAEAVGRSRSYLSKKFKKELGFNLSDFIMRRKLEEGKSLLAYSEKSISEISEYLCFSSQSYFQNVFKKKYHMTPYEYRKSMR